MRLLVACSQCQRQYDATGKPVGSRFRCHCNAVVTVKPPKGHDAAVVLCSSCGAPREEGSASCGFCEADFTLHERDLDTVCPQCLARISDRARFCHHCGTRLAPERVAGDETPLVCPVCGDPHHLTSRRVGRIAVMECGRCVGLWLGNEAFRQVTEEASADALKTDEGFRPKRPERAGSRPPPQQGSRYRKCVVCGHFMHRRNFGRRSGVIIDVCRDDGVWFDAEELPRIVAWIRSGGLAKANEDRAAKAARERRIERRTAERSPGRAGVLGEMNEHRNEFVLGTALIEVVSLLFRR